MWGPQDDADSIRALHTALDRGVNFIDTAQVYGQGHSEAIVGRVLQERSDEIYVATKVPQVPGLTWPTPDDADPTAYIPASYLIERCEASLRRLKRETIDVYQVHTWASAFNLRDEWFEAMEKLRRQGKIRAVGVSVPDTAPDCVIGALVQGRVDAVQVIYNLFEQAPQRNLFPVCQAHDVAVIARVPFDEGALTGKFTYETTFPEGDLRRRYFRGDNLRAVVDRTEAIRAFKDERHPEMAMAEYALRFCLSHPAVTTVIPGMRTPRQAEMNTAAGDGALLPEEEVDAARRFAWRKDFWREEVEAEPQEA